MDKLGRCSDISSTLVVKPSIRRFGSHGRFLVNRTCPTVCCRRLILALAMKMTRGIKPGEEMYPCGT